MHTSICGQLTRLVLGRRCLSQVGISLWLLELTLAMNSRSVLHGVFARTLADMVRWQRILHLALLLPEV